MAGKRSSRLFMVGAALVAAVVVTVAVFLLVRGRAPAAPVTAAPRPTASGSPAPRDDIRNVILVSLDTVRWDAVAAYGAPEVNSPNIAALGRQGAVFENCFAPIPITLPSHASMLTGKIPLAHGVFDNGRYQLGAAHETLAEVLAGHGFKTAAFVSALVLEERFGLGQGFSVYDDEIPEAAVIGERRGDLTTARAIDWLAHHAGERNFLFLHLFDPHAPYEAPEPFASEIRRLYTKYPPVIQDYVAEIAFADHCVGLLLEALRGLGLYDSSLIVVTADHGESTGDHGENTHGYFIYTSTMKVPLVVKVPGGRVGVRVREPVAITDIPTTVLALLGLAFEADVQGHDLSASLRGQEGLYPDRALVGMSLEPRKYGATALVGVVVGDYQYIQAPRPELYNLARDVYAQRNLVDVEVAVADGLRERLAAILERPEVQALPERLSVDADTRRLLEQLGYVVEEEAGAEPDAGAAVLDPKDLIAYHRAMLSARSYVAPGNHDRALAAAEEMIRMRPDFYLGYLMKGRVLHAAGKGAEAAALLEKARALGPDDLELTL